jgi:hypothetical protein
MLNNYYWINGNIILIEYDNFKSIYFKKIDSDLIKTIHPKDLKMVPKIYWRSLLRDISYNKKTLAEFFNDKPYFPKCYFKLEDVDKNDKRYFLKPHQGSQGYGIKVINDLFLLEKIPDDFLLQEEIVPDLIHQKKYDIRMYFCIIHYKNNLEFFISRDGKVRISNEDYNLQEEKGSITNSSQIKKESNNFHQQMKWSNLENFNTDYKTVIENFKDIISSLKNQKIFDTYMGQNIFNLYGVDLIKGYDGKYYLLEFNSNPNFFHKNDSKEITEMKENILENLEKILENIIYQENNEINFWLKLN